MSSGCPRRCARDFHLERWYPVEANVFYRIDRGRIVSEGTATTLKLSSKHIVLKSGARIPSGVTIEAWVEWPARLDNVIPIRLHIHGKTLHAEDGQVTLSILRHEFRVSGRPRTPAGGNRVIELIA